MELERGIIFDSGKMAEFDNSCCKEKSVYSLHLMRSCPCEVEDGFPDPTPQCGVEELGVIKLQPGKIYINRIAIKEVL